MEDCTCGLPDMLARIDAALAEPDRLAAAEEAAVLRDYAVMARGNAWDALKRDAAVYGSADCVREATGANADAGALDAGADALERLAVVERERAAAIARATAAEAAEHMVTAEWEASVNAGAQFQRERDEARAERDAALRKSVVLDEALDEVIAERNALIDEANPCPDVRWDGVESDEGTRGGQRCILHRAHEGEHVYVDSMASLRAEVARLTAERDDLRAKWQEANSLARKHLSDLIPGGARLVSDGIVAARATIDVLRVEVARLREGVECHAARPGEGTYECAIDRQCPACRLRTAEAKIARLRDVRVVDVTECYHCPHGKMSRCLLTGSVLRFSPGPPDNCPLRERWTLVRLRIP